MIIRCLLQAEYVLLAITSFELNYIFVTSVVGYEVITDDNDKGTNREADYQPIDNLYGSNGEQYDENFTFNKHGRNGYRNLSKLRSNSRMMNSLFINK